jgi:hypothetical protein
MKSQFALIGQCQLSVANSNLDGTGTLGTLVTAGNVETLIAPASPSATLVNGGTLTAAQAYYYKVTALNAQGETAASAEVNATATGATLSIAIAWTSQVWDTGGYKIYRGLSAGQENKLLATVPAGQNVFLDDGSFTGTPATPPSTGTALGNDVLIDYVVFKATVTNVAGMLRLFIYDGSNTRLLDEVPTTATTPSATVQSDRHVWSPVNSLWLSANQGHVLKCSTEKAETWNAFAFGAGYSGAF